MQNCSSKSIELSHATAKSGEKSESTVKKFNCQTHQHLKKPLQTLLMAYNFTKRLKTLKGLTPYQFICAAWQKDPDRFTLNPITLWD